jgi:hypothetical protein
MCKLYEETCSRCGGAGVWNHGRVTFTVTGQNGRDVSDRWCFKCNGSGKEFFKTSPEQREKNREAARKRKEAKMIAEREAREAKERETYGGYTMAELAEMQKQQRAEAEKAEAAQSEWLGEVGEKVELTGTCIFAKAYEGFYGWKTLFIIKTEDGSIAKFYTTSQTFDDVEKGNTVEMTGKVKAQDINADRHNQKITVLERVKCQDTYRIIEEEAAS